MEVSIWFALNFLKNASLPWFSELIYSELKSCLDKETWSLVEPVFIVWEGSFVAPLKYSLNVWDQSLNTSNV